MLKFLSSTSFCSDFLNVVSLVYIYLLWLCHMVKLQDQSVVVLLDRFVYCTDTITSMLKCHH